MGLYERIANEKRGEEARVNEMAENEGNQIAQRRLEEAALREAEAEMGRRDQAQRDATAFSMGQRDGATRAVQGLGMGSQTTQSIQQNENMRSSSMQDAAMQIIAEVENAKANGASQQQLTEMINSIPPELAGPIKQIQAKRQQASGSGEVGQPQNTAGSGQIQRPNSGITDYARNLLQ